MIPTSTVYTTTRQWLLIDLQLPETIPQDITERFDRAINLLALAAEQAHFQRHEMFNLLSEIALQHGALTLEKALKDKIPGHDNATLGTIYNIAKTKSIIQEGSYLDALYLGILRDRNNIAHGNTAMVTTGSPVYVSLLAVKTLLLDIFSEDKATP